MACYLLHHRHEPGECGVVFASFKGHDSPLRRRATLASCRSGGHAIWWAVEADSEEDALRLLPFYVAERTSITPRQRGPDPVSSSAHRHITGAIGRWLLHIPFGISAVRESQVQPPVDRSEQAG